MEKFDLERFKAGEPAIDEGGQENYFFGTLPNDYICFYFEEGSGYDVMAWSLDEIEKYMKMKPKEEWVVVPKYKYKEEFAAWFFPHSSKEEALKSVANTPNPEYFEVVKIIRE